MLSPRPQNRGSYTPHRAHLSPRYQFNTTLVSRFHLLIAISPTHHVRHRLLFSTIARPSTLGNSSICTVCAPQAITRQYLRVMPATHMRSPALTPHGDRWSRVYTARTAHPSRTYMESRLKRHPRSQLLGFRPRWPRRKHREVLLDKSRPN